MLIEGKNEFKDVIRFCRTEYENKNESETRMLTFHATTGTDTKLMRKIVEDVIAFITRQALDSINQL